VHRQLHDHFIDINPCKQISVRQIPLQEPPQFAIHAMSMQYGDMRQSDELEAIRKQRSF